MNELTTSQAAALKARGNVLVVAGAGTGKTSTLVERCCALLLEENCSLDKILMVTFTDAAAADMRWKVRKKLSEKLTAAPDNGRLEEQLALLDLAHISTLHSFCLKLVREHFHQAQLRLDPQFAVLTEEQVHQLRHETMDALLEAHYGGDSAEAQAFQNLVARQARGAEGRVRELIWQLHRYAQSLADPDGWFAQQLAAFNESEPTQWRAWFASGFVQWRDDWLPTLLAQPDENVPARRCAELFATFSPGKNDIAVTLTELLATDDDALWPKKRKTFCREPLKKFYEEADFLQSLTPSAANADPLAEDWGWARPPMQTLLRLAREFGEQFSRAKREAGGVDFADLEQFALRLLWDAPTGQPTPLAQEWRARLKHVFVDEYQDINAAQDTILRAVSRDGAAANRFLVGDVKQSIYRFRLADPAIFQRYKCDWEKRAAAGQTIPLSHNFRSRQALLEFINPLFAALMRAEIGGVGYAADAHLQFGASEKRAPLSHAADPTPQVEIHLRVKDRDDDKPETDDDAPAGKAWAELADLEATEQEARLVALRLRALRDEKFKVWDDEQKDFRAVEWRDMVILLRAPASKVEGFAKEFSRAGVPLHAARGGFYETTEISDLLSLLQLLDNPLQDLPLLAVLRSPLVGLSPDELTVIRAGSRAGQFWQALLTFCLKPARLDAGAEQIAAAARPKVKTFLTMFDAWRRRARQGSLSETLETVLAETHYDSLLLAQPRGEERRANVHRFLKLVRQFDPYQRQGLLRFLKFVETQRDAEAAEAPAPPATVNAVRLMSIHKSKGLEFPVVVVPDLGKPFNLSDLRADILLDAEYGLCPRIAPPGRNGHYPSLPYWLARRRQHREALGEELRLLYVALTRAKDRLLLTATTNARALDEWRNSEATTTIATRDILSGRSYLSWLLRWLPHVTQPKDWKGETGGENQLARWTIYSENDERLLSNPDKSADAEAKPAAPVPTEELVARLTRVYPFGHAVHEPAKTSVTALRRRLEDETDAEAHPLWRPPISSRPARQSGLSATEIGTAHHTFLQFVTLDRLDGETALQREAERLVAEKILTAPEKAALDFAALTAFWQSDLGGRIRAQAAQVRRELPFTARFAPAELATMMGGKSEPDMDGEFVVVQGVADLVVLLPEEIWLVDFKTDAVKAGALETKAALYAPQLKLYARALAGIHQRPVTECRLYFLALRQSVSVEV